MTTTPVFYDTHAHLDYPDFANDLPDVLRRAAEAGIERVVCVGTDFASTRRAIELSEQHASLAAVAGWHPGHVTEAPDDIRAELRQLARHPRVAALGETGLDFYRLPSKKGGSPQDDARYMKRQCDLFAQHLQVAAELGLNCVVHQRSAWDETLEVFRPYASRVRAVFHCFVDGPAAVKQVLELGSLVSYTGILTFKNAADLRAGLEAAPLGHFMLETDAPFLAPVPYRGKRAEPAHVREIATAAASVKSCSLEELSTATCETAQGFFRHLIAVQPSLAVE
jgi:TatD DNase family protein